jgi:hypothetical protein
VGDPVIEYEIMAEKELEMAESDGIFSKEQLEAIKSKEEVEIFLRDIFDETDFSVERE